MFKKLVVLLLFSSSLSTPAPSSSDPPAAVGGLDEWPPGLIISSENLNAVVQKMARQIVAKMDLTKVFNSNICPDVFTPEMCKKDSNGAFYVWVRELRQRALVKQLEEETAKKLQRRLIQNTIQQQAMKHRV